MCIYMSVQAQLDKETFPNLSQMSCFRPSKIALSLPSLSIRTFGAIELPEYLVF